MIIAGMATIPERIDLLKVSIASIVTQFDQIYLYLNRFHTVPDFIKQYPHIIPILGEDTGDVGKFYGIKNVGDYYFTLDDDILYPHDYRSTLINKIKELNTSCVCVHANTLPMGEISSYYQDKIGLHFERKLDEDTLIDIPGTGTMCIDIKKMKLSYTDIPVKNMTDLTMARYLQKNGIKAYAIKRKDNWLTQLKHPVLHSHGIRSNFQKNDEAPTELARQLQRTKLFNEQGYLVIKNFFNDKQIYKLTQVVNSLQKAPESINSYMKYFEKDSRGKTLLNRVEYFLHPNEYLYDGILPLVKDLLEKVSHEKWTLFKEKINFKLPGASGFAPHQDGHAFSKYIDDMFISVMIPVDKATKENGCLEVAHKTTGNQLLSHPQGGAISLTQSNQFKWKPLELNPGDLVIFDSYLPHRSQENNSSQERRSYFFTFNRALHGNLREKYFTHKRKVFPPRIERKEDLSLLNSSELACKVF